MNLFQYLLLTVSLKRTKCMISSTYKLSIGASVTSKITLQNFSQIELSARFFCLLIMRFVRLEQRIHTIGGKMSADDAAHRRVPFRFRLRGRDFHVAIRLIWASKLPSAIPTNLLPLGAYLQPTPGGEDEQVQRHSDSRGYSQRFR